MKKFKTIVTPDYGPLAEKVVLAPDFFSGFDPVRRQAIVAEEAAYYHQLTANYSVKKQLETKYVTVQSFDGTGIQVKVYCPKGVKQTLPALLFAHGGGFMTCSVETHDFIPAYIAAKTGVAAFSVEYRLAPEHPYPTGLEDCYAVLQWMTGNAEELSIDPSQITVAGDSSGGNFAIALTLLAKQRGDVMLHKQVLIYPVTDLSGTVEKRSAKVYTMVGEADGEGGIDLLSIYLGPKSKMDAKDPLISPLFATDVSGLPSALFIEAECDALLDDGLMYAKKLQDAKVPVAYKIYSGMPHAFILRTYEETFAALDTICDFLKN